jgi:Ca2+:H+ antiporter
VEKVEEPPVVKGTPHEPPSIKRILVALFCTRLNVLMFVTPFALWAHSNTAVTGPTMAFTLALLSIVLFAERLSFVTEQFALHTSQTIAGLLNATCCNVPEMIVTVMAMTKDEVRIAQESLLGAIISDLLLVPGVSFIVGGLKHRMLRFNGELGGTLGGLAMLSSFSLLLPNALANAAGSRAAEANVNAVDHDISVLSLSRIIAVMLLFAYAALLIFQLGTHRDLFEDDSNNPAVDEEEEEQILTMYQCIGVMFVIIVVISFLSDCLVDTISESAISWNVSPLFLAAYVLPLVTNCTEYAVAIVCSLKGKMDLVLGVCIGAGIQGALFTLPAAVLVAWPLGVPMSFDFHSLETWSLLITVIISTYQLQAGRATWLGGVVMVMVYMIVAVSYACLKRIAQLPPTATPRGMMDLVANEGTAAWPSTEPMIYWTGMHHSAHGEHHDHHSVMAAGGHAILPHHG